jgi:hypothetical protein
MTTTKKSLLPAALAALLLGGVVLPATAQDFSRFVALGDSLGAGFVSGGLAIHPQERSVPALVARQAGVQDFQMPLISEPGIPPLLAIAGFQGASPVIVPRSNQPGAPLNLNLPRPYNNLSVPGFDVSDVIRTVTGNALIDIILRGQGPALSQAVVGLQPTFALVWIGNNDVLAAATSGIVIEGVTLTPVASFRNDFRTLLGALANGGAELVVATLPDVTVIPFVTTIPPVVVNPATGQPVLFNGQTVPIIGPAGPLGPGDRVLLTASTQLVQGIGIPAALGGTNQPLGDQYVLSAGELATIQARVAALNDVIRQAATDFGAAVADINGLLNRARTGYPVGGNITVTTAFLTGGVFSYDGVHPTPLGNAIAANEFIRAINARFGDDIEPVNLTPFVFGPDGSAGATIELPGLGTGTPIFTTAAAEALRLSLQVPPARELLRLKAERERPRERRDQPRAPVKLRGGRRGGS